MRGYLRLFRRAYGGHLRATLSLSVPVIIGQLGHVLMGFIDNLMIGQLGYVHLSAASLANGAFLLLTVLGIGITFAISPLVAEADAGGRAQQAGRYLRQGMWLGLGLGLGLVGLVMAAGASLPYLDQPPADVALARSYVYILAWSALPMMLFLVAKQFADGLALTVPAMVVTLIGLACNTGLNWLLIYGHLGFPRLELDGAGYGTLISRVVMMGLMIGYVLRARRFRVYALTRGWGRFRPAVMYKILRIGLPSGLQYFFEVGAFIGAVVIIGWLDNPSASRAAHQIAIQLASITYMVVTGISAGATIRVGQALGRQHFLDLRRAGLAGVYVSLGFMLLTAIGFLAGRQVLPRLFIEDLGVIHLASHLLIFAAAFQLFDGVQAVGVGILRGMQDVRIPTLITLVVYWGISLPVGYLLSGPLGLGVVGIWYGFVLGLGLAAVLLTRRFWRLSGRLISQAATQPAPV